MLKKNGFNNGGGREAAPEKPPSRNLLENIELRQSAHLNAIFS